MCYFERKIIFLRHSLHIDCRSKHIFAHKIKLILIVPRKFHNVSKLIFNLTIQKQMFSKKKEFFVWI